MNKDSLKRKTLHDVVIEAIEGKKFVRTNNPLIKLQFTSTGMSFSTSGEDHILDTIDYGCADDRLDMIKNYKLELVSFLNFLKKWEEFKPSPYFSE